MHACQHRYGSLQHVIIVSPKQYTPAALSLGSSLPQAGRSGLEQFRISDSVPKQSHCTFRIPPKPFPNTTPFISGTAVVLKVIMSWQSCAHTFFNACTNGLSFQRTQVACIQPLPLPVPTHWYRDSTMVLGIDHITPRVPHIDSGHPSTEHHLLLCSYLRVSYSNCTIYKIVTNA